MRSVSHVIIFDLFGVICSEIAPVWLPHYVGEEEAKVAKATIVGAADRGEISQHEMFSRLGQIAELSPEQVEKEWWSYVNIDSNVVEIIRILRIDHKIGLLSNSPSQFARKILNKSSLTPLFDTIVISSEEKCVKPDPKIYQLTLDRLATQAEHALLIDDNPVNLKGARDIGMKGILFKSYIQLRKALSDLKYLD